jgi:hypothetical protein
MYNNFTVILKLTKDKENVNLIYTQIGVVFTKDFRNNSMVLEIIDTKIGYLLSETKLLQQTQAIVYIIRRCTASIRYILDAVVSIVIGLFKTAVP